ncbi:MAG TPA: hypothetical protein VFF82_12020 [Rhodocyclaceae bacterium]|nr:hypothetical protein [Rhodocyclaceae bacterium]
MTANALPDPALQISTTLRPPLGTPPSETERSLLRLEARSGQSRVDETALIDDMVARLRHMAQTTDELHTLIATTPTRPCAPAAIVCPTATEPPTSEFADLPWLPLAGGAGILALLGLWWRQRRDKPDIPPDETLPKMRPSAPAPAVKAVDQRQEKAAVEPLPAKAELPVPAPAATKKAVLQALPVPTLQPETAAGPMPSEADDAVADADLSLELADVMLSMGLAEGAAQTLSDHIRMHPRQALYHWLKLLDIYRKSGMKEEFDKSAQELQQHFNIAPPDWQAVDAANRLPSLESYTHIINRTQELWPRRSCADYLNRLLDDNRGGTRAGFPQPVIEEMLFLLAILRD